MEERTVLIVDGSDEDRAALRTVLGTDPNCRYTCLEEARVASALHTFRTREPDCIVLDYSLPDGTALDFLEAIKDERGRVPRPVVVVAECADQEATVALMRAGAHDFLVKAETASEVLRRAVSNAIYKAHAQRQLEEQRAELERLYADAQNWNAELRAAKEAAEQANAAKDEFLAMLSHELRTPLTPVLSIVSAILADPKQLSADWRETFALIRRNVQLEARLIDDLLDLTRVLHGRFEVHKSPVDAHACIQAAIDVCQTDFDAKNIALCTELAAPRSTVNGDFARIQQVLWNLLRNAAHFTPSGGQVNVFTHNDQENLVVEIRDTGIGISPERLKEIFDAFNRAPSARRSGSLGLGLSIARAVVDAHGGALTATSDGTDRGTIFRLRLPSITVRPVKGDEGQQSGTVTTSGAGRTILIVEDHEDTLRVLSRALRRKGFGVVVATSVETACKQFEQHPPDLLICDIGLPDGTGWDVMIRVSQHRPVRAIAVSGYGTDQDVERSRAAGFIAHITKPVDFAHLETIVTEVLA